MKLSDQIKGIMAKVFEINVSEITDDATPEIIEKWNSLGHMNLIIALEEEFKITFEDEQIVELVSFSAINEEISKLKPVV